MPHGVLVIDKPSGPTSHDVVQLVRRAFRTRAVGHAGTLDPLATGVLVLGVGEATKLLHYLSGVDKAYLATITLGTLTDSLDAQGRVLDSAPVPADLSLASVSRVAERFLGDQVQRVPDINRDQARAENRCTCVARVAAKWWMRPSAMCTCMRSTFCGSSTAASSCACTAARGSTCAHWRATCQRRSARSGT